MIPEMLLEKNQLLVCSLLFNSMIPEMLLEKNQLSVYSLLFNSMIPEMLLEKNQLLYAQRQQMLHLHAPSTTVVMHILACMHTLPTQYRHLTHSRALRALALGKEVTVA